MKTLKFQILVFSVLLLCLLAMFVWLSMRRSFEARKFSEEYGIKNRIAGHLNAAAGWQAIERGYGAIILGSGKGETSPLFSNFLEMIKRGDSEVLQTEKHIKKLISVKSDKTFEEQVNKWHKGYEALVSTRHKITGNDISKEEWLYTATVNINNEFNLRGTIFTPERMEEKVLYLNNVLRPNIARLCEYAGLERALIGNAIASGKPLANETINRIKEYRSIVELSLGQVLLLKDLPSTSDQTKQVIEEFEKEFLQKFQLLREEVFVSSRKQEDQIKAASIQIIKRKKVFQSFLQGASIDLLNISKHKSVLTLSEALMVEYDGHTSERINTVENLFSAFSQAKRSLLQIRFLDNLGHERVRVDSDGDTTRIISGRQLQDKSERYYFKETINLPPGSIYTSPLDLNTEHGKAELPYKPTIRFATPVFVNGKQTGVVVINIIANSPFFLHKVIEKEGKEDYILANQDGFYLHHPDEEREWGMMGLPGRSYYNIRQDYPDVAEQILSGREGSVRLISGEMLIYKPVSPNLDTNTSEFWVIIKKTKEMEYIVDAATWFDRATKAIDSGLAISNIAGVEANAITLEMESITKRNVQIDFYIFVITVLIFIFFIWWSRSRILKPIQKLTLLTQKISKGDFTSRAEVKFADEIGLLSASFNKMAVDLQESNRAIQESEEKVRTIIASTQDAIILLDNEERVSYWNEAAERMFDYSNESVLGKNVHEFIIPERFREDHLKGFKRFKDTGQGPVIGETVELAAIRKDGTEFPIELSLSGVQINGKWNAVGVVRDITERKQMNKRLLAENKGRKKVQERLKQTVAELKRSNTELQQFAYVASHDLQEPLRMVASYTQLLGRRYKGKLDSDADEFIAYAVDGANRMQMLITALLGYSHIGALKKDLDLIACKDVFDQAVSNLQVSIEKNGAVVTQDALPTVKADFSQLVQLLQNLIGNAIKFCSEDSPSVHVSAEQKKNEWVFSVRDNGIGIDPQYADRIFSVFQRLHKISEYSGSGIGLAICKKIVENHGGRIWVESEPGKGTTFYFTIPDNLEDKQS